MSPITTLAPSATSSPRVLCAHAPGAAADQCNFSVHASHDGSGYLARVLQVEPVPVLRKENIHGDPRRAHRHRQLRQPRARQLVERRALRPDRRLGVHGRQGGQGRGRAGRAGCYDRRRRRQRPRRDHRGQARLRRLLRDGRHPACRGHGRHPHACSPRVSTSWVRRPAYCSTRGRSSPTSTSTRVEDAAREGDSTVFITGVDPGFATDLLPFALAGTLPEHRADPHHGDRRLRDLRRRRR